jgi:hypothetical protein
MIKGVDDTSLLNQNSSQPAFLQFDAAGETGRTGADHERIEVIQSMPSTVE